MGVVRTGAQRASFHQRLAVVLTGTFIATLFGFAVAAATPAPAAASTPPWYDVEVYYLKLVNCTRTGGWVQSDGSCTGYGSGRYSKYVAPLKLNSNLSAVARKWAKYLSLTDQCKHGDPGARLRAAGYTSWRWGENIGCRNGDANAFRAVLWSHRAFQAEKSSGGGHWKNIKNPMFKYIGIGLWKDHNRVRLVTDFFSF